jgi:hypothetical protein
MRFLQFFFAWISFVAGTCYLLYLMRLFSTYFCKDQKKVEQRNLPSGRNAVKYSEDSAGVRVMEV